MSDDKTKRGGQDPQRVNIHQPWELRTWTKKFDCTTDELKRAVASVLAEGYEPTVVRVGDRLKWFKRFDAKAKKPAAKKSAAKKPAAKKPAAKKPATKKPAAKKPATKVKPKPKAKP